MINNSKITQKNNTQQIAGLFPEDNNIEFAGISETKEVLWIQNGRTLPFKYLPKWAYRLCQQQYLNDAPALSYLSKQNNSTERQVEIYIYHLYGAVDTVADIKNGKLTPSENFREVKNDPSLDWDFKWITIDDITLTTRDLQIIDAFIEGIPDKTLAIEMGISHSTLDFHKRNLYKKLNVQSKTELIVKALKQQI